MLKKIIKKISVKDSSQPKNIVNAYNEKCFFVHNGPVLCNLPDLLRELKYMSDAQFTHHVNREKNDFANWVEEVLQDRECARALKKANTPKKAAEVVEKHLKETYSV